MLSRIPMRLHRLLSGQAAGHWQKATTKQQPQRFGNQKRDIKFAAIKSPGASHAITPVSPHSTMRIAIVGNAATPKLKAQYDGANGRSRIATTPTKVSSANSRAVTPLPEWPTRDRSRRVSIQCAQSRLRRRCPPSHTCRPLLRSSTAPNDFARPVR